MNNKVTAHTFLQKHPEVYGWDKIQVGPDFTIEPRDYFWEIQRKGGHAGKGKYLDAALAEVLNQDLNIDLEKDVREWKKEETRKFTEKLLSGKRTIELTFEAWLAMVNTAVVTISGVSLADIGDFESWALWDSGTLPYEAAREALEASDFPFED
jgi:hypothetical protein